ncbi:glycosyltransferase family 2 protein [Lacticaseibacillus absianus]|uniref:glycosyltransferase family 2 protein n=1 Tax=Lacticaseibacillus absianus TaxID=2729623 RepID=UPI0015C719E7|nr:glycosyltransferase [Lacticaseibacillus absianus]
MEKQLSIIMPFRRETITQITRMLTSLNNQIGVDWSTIEVLLVGDGVDRLPAEVTACLSQTSARQVTYRPSRGAGVARQVGIDQTRGRYVMFLDADDVLADVFVLRDMLQVVATQAHQLVIARYTKQRRVGQEFHYECSAAHDWKAAYGKLYNRAYLVASGVRWLPDLRIFEDTYFVGCVCELATDISYLDRSVYVWLWNPVSTVRRDHHAFDHQLHDWARANQAALAVMHAQKPQVWSRDFDTYMADLYFRTRQYVPADVPAFRAAHTRLLVANRQLWNPSAKQRIWARISELAQPGKRYAGAAVDGVERYLKAQDQILRLAFEESRGQA